jgi:hypothetical protein
LPRERSSGGTPGFLPAAGSALVTVRVSSLDVRGHGLTAWAPPGASRSPRVCGAAVLIPDGLIAHGGPDSSGHAHRALPWTGCTILGGTPEDVAAVRARAASQEDVLLVDMSAAAPAHRVYDHYLAELARTDPSDLAVRAFSLVGPRNRVDQITKKLIPLP